jgi:mono/diheme cytochrome c family protein
MLMERDLLGIIGCMRELWSLRLVGLSGILIVALAVGFACGQNPPEQPAASAPEPTPALPEPAPSASTGDPVAKGKQIYARERCSRCHSIGGQGSPRSPLDGVGGRLIGQELTNWIIAPESLQDEMAPSAFRAKQAYAELPKSDLDALTAYLASLK